MNQQPAIIPHLFRTEYRKLVAVLCKLFGVGHIAIAEDIASDTFLLASELWGVKGLPENPTAWLYTVAKNKTKDRMRRDALFAERISKELARGENISQDIEVDLSDENINDSQLAMIFVACHPCNPPESQIALALNLLCGFNAEEIASALLTTKDAVYKILQRGKQKLRVENMTIDPPSAAQIDERLPSVLMTLYLLFNEGYYSANEDVTLRKNLCLEAIRLTFLLVENKRTNRPMANALLSLMCFHSSRFDARVDPHGAMVLYHDQDPKLWNQELIAQGEYFLHQAIEGDTISKYHLEAGIAYWHTISTDDHDKWENILKLYNQLLVIEYSPIAALNRTYALSMVKGNASAIAEAEKINLTGNHLYYSLLGELYREVDPDKAIGYLQSAYTLARSPADRKCISEKMEAIQKVP